MCGQQEHAANRFGRKPSTVCQFGISRGKWPIFLLVWRTRDDENGRNRLPAAMLAGVVDTLMSFEDLFDAVMGSARTKAA